MFIEINKPNNFNMMSSKILKIFKFSFPEINFKTRSKISEEVREMFNSSSSIQEREELFFALKALEKELKIAKKKLSKAIKLYKEAEITRDELSDYEYAVYELETQIDEIVYRL